MAKSQFLNRTLPSWIFRRRAACAWFAQTSLFAGPVNDFNEIVDKYHADLIENGSGSSEWQNRSIGFLSMNVDLRPRLHEIQCPILIIQGSKDIGIAPKHTRTGAESIPNAAFELIEGAGHWAKRQCAEAVNAIISAFLKS